MASLFRFIGTLALASLLLTACGKRGHLEPPAGQTVEKPPVEARAGSAGSLKAKRQPVPVPKRDLPIDWILE